MLAAVHKTKLETTLGREEIISCTSQKPQRAAVAAAAAFGSTLQPQSHPHRSGPNHTTAKRPERKKHWRNIRGEEEESRERERQRGGESLRAWHRCQPNPKTRPAKGTVPVSLFEKFSSDFVINVGRALRWHLLDYVDRVAIITADLLVVRAEDAVSSPERDDDVAGLWAVIVPAAAAPFGRGQGA